MSQMPLQQYPASQEEAASQGVSRVSKSKPKSEPKPKTNAKPGTAAKTESKAGSKTDPEPEPKLETQPKPESTSKAKDGGNGDVVRVDFAFRRELARKIEGNLAGFCYQCGACVGDCPATTYGSEFNPREIMLKILYGLGGELLTEDSVLWQCTNCYNCHERCPQEVKPVEVIISLKNMLADRGIYPPAVSKVIETFETTGRTTPLTPAVDRQREKFGLPPLSPIPMDEIKKLIEPASKEGGSD